MNHLLREIRVVELGALGPVPHAAMQLADLGADVVRVERPDHVTAAGGGRSAIMRQRRIVSLDLKSEHDRDELLTIIERADVLIEGFRPGVMERLGLGPTACCDRNPRLVYARMTGWGQSGPRAATAGHDLTYLAVSGVLSMLGDGRNPPRPPLNLIADYGGGSTLLVLGILAALLERERSGQGQVIDCAMIDGVSLLAQQIWAMRDEGQWIDEPGGNLLDGGAPFYRTYTCRDGRYLAVAALEPKFYDLFLTTIGLGSMELPDQYDSEQWPQMAELIAGRIAELTRDQWVERFEGVDACVAPVLEPAEAVHDEHLNARGTFTRSDEGLHVAPAPRFGRRPNGAPEAWPTAPTRQTAQDVLSRWHLAP